MSAHGEFYSALFAEEPIEVEVEVESKLKYKMTLSENDWLVCEGFSFVARGANASSSTCK